MLPVRAQPAATPTAVPPLVKFTGTLTGAAGRPITGVVGVTFALYASEQGGSPLWMETHNVLAGGRGQPLVGKTVQPPGPATANASPNLTGTGMKNYIAIWTTASALATSKIYQTAAGNIGIGTTTPAATLQAVATGATGTGVIGRATAASGANYGVYGSTANPAGIAVYGANNATTGSA